MLRRLGLVAGGGSALFGGYFLSWRVQEKSKPFSSYSTAEQAANNVNLNGKTAIVTGCNTGIGKETARVLVKQGCNVIMACRTPSKAEDARKDILNALKLSNDYDKLNCITLDLSSLESVSSFVNQFNQESNKGNIDYLINNAGIMALPQYKTSKEGFEMQFATNHLGHFYLTQLLLPNLISAKTDAFTPRVVNVSSRAESMVRDYDKTRNLFDTCLQEIDFMGSLRGDYDPWESYGYAKLSNVFFARQLSKRNKNNIVSVSLHPGGIQTNLQQHLKPSDIFRMLQEMRKMGASMKTMFGEAKSIPQGAATTIRCVSMTENEIEPGMFYANCEAHSDEIGPVTKDPNGELAEKLWELSVKLVESKGFAIPSQSQ